MGLTSTREIHYDDESAYAETSTTYTVRIPVTSVDTETPEQARTPTDGAIMSRQNEARAGFALTRSGAEFGFGCLAGGHGTAATGALSATWLYTLLKDGLGGGIATQAGGAISTATSATSFITAGTAVRGGVVLIGAKGDARADGMACAVSDESSGTVTLLTALPATMSTADTMKAALMVYPSETLGTSKRFMMGYADTGNQWHYRGCHLSGLGLTVPMDGSDLPKLSLKYQAAYWDRSAVTVPSTTPALSDIEAAPVGGGQVFLQTVGTTTRAIINPVSIELSLDIANAIEHSSYAAQPVYQSIRQMSRLRCIPTVSFLVPWSTSYESLWDTDGPDTVYKQILVQLSGTAGRVFGFYMPKAFLISPRPAVQDHNGLCYQRLTFRGREGSDLTSELSKSAVRFFLA